MTSARKLIESTYFIIFLNLLALIFWNFHVTVFSYIIYLLLFIIIVIVKANRIVLTTIILVSIINFRVVQSPDYINVYINNTKIFIPLTIIALMFAAYDFYKRKKVIVYKNEIFYGLIAILIASLLSSINATNATLLLIIIGILQTLAYVLIFFYVLNIKDENSQNYLAKSILILGVTIALQLIIHYQKIGLIGAHDINWGISNSISMFYLALIPVGMYLYFLNQKRFYILLINGFFFLMMLFMLSRGSYFTTIILLIPFFITSLLIVKSKKQYLLHLMLASIICLSVGAVILWKFDLFSVIIEYFKTISLDGSGRKEIYLYGLSLFKEYPLFGAGAYSGAYYLRQAGLEVSTYHNYLIHALASTGIIGFAAFLYYLITVFKNLISRNVFNICLLFSVLALVIQGLVDNSFFSPIFSVYLALLLPLVNKKAKNIVLVNRVD